MNLFQWLSLPLLGVLIAVELIRAGRGGTTGRLPRVRMLVWTAAAVAIAWPDLLTKIASVLGIGRGTDLVLYVFILLSLAAAFYFYSRYVLLERQITELVRREALREARRGTTDSPGIR